MTKKHDDDAKGRPNLRVVPPPDDDQHDDADEDRTELLEAIAEETQIAVGEYGYEAAKGAQDEKEFRFKYLLQFIEHARSHPYAEHLIGQEPPLDREGVADLLVRIAEDIRIGRFPIEKGRTGPTPELYHLWLLDDAGVDREELAEFAGMDRDELGEELKRARKLLRKAGMLPPDDEG